MTRKGGGGNQAPSLLDRLARRMTRETAAATSGDDADFVRAQISRLARYSRYFSPSIRGVDNLPDTGPAIIVGNHSCIFYMPDVWVVALAILARRGFEAPVHPLGYDLLFALPGVGDFIRKIGVVPARGEKAEEVVRRGEAVLVYPGGDWEAARPWTARNRIDFHGHKGFIRLALRTGAPIVPVVSQGAHDAIFVVSRGDALARRMGLGRLRINVFPILFGPPFGLTPVVVPPVPMPSAVAVEFLPPMRWEDLAPESSTDPEVVGACYKEVTSTMQSTLDRLRSENPHPVLRGISRLVSGRSTEDTAFCDVLEAATQR